MTPPPFTISVTSALTVRRSGLVMARTVLDASVRLAAGGREYSPLSVRLDTGNAADLTLDADTARQNGLDYQSLSSADEVTVTGVTATAGQPALGRLTSARVRFPPIPDWFDLTVLVLPPGSTPGRRALLGWGPLYRHLVVQPQTPADRDVIRFARI